MLKGSLRLSEMPCLSSFFSCGWETRLVGAALSLSLPAELCWQQQREGLFPLPRVRVVCRVMASVQDDQLVCLPVVLGGVCSICPARFPPSLPCSPCLWPSGWCNSFCSRAAHLPAVANRVGQESALYAVWTQHHHALPNLLCLMTLQHSV